MCEIDLADGCGCLTIFELERSLRQLEHIAAKRDGAGRDDDHLFALRPQIGDVVAERTEPFAA
jgi:hypothetical protein